MRNARCDRTEEWTSNDDDSCFLPGMYVQVVKAMCLPC